MVYKKRDLFKDYKFEKTKHLVQRDHISNGYVIVYKYIITHRGMYFKEVDTKYEMTKVIKEKVEHDFAKLKKV